MRKILLLLLCLVMIVGCQSKNGLANPMTQRDSLAEVNELTHGHLTKPGVMGISNEKYATIDTKEGLIGQYDFTFNENEYTVRFSDVILNEDISGIWIDGNPAFNDDKSIVRASDDEYQIARWFTVDGQYSLTAPASVKHDIFEAVVDELTALSVMQ